MLNVHTAARDSDNGHVRLRSDQFFDMDRQQTGRRHHSGGIIVDHAQREQRVRGDRLTPPSLASQSSPRANRSGAGRRSDRVFG